MRKFNNRLHPFDDLENLSAMKITSIAVNLRRGFWAFSVGVKLDLCRRTAALDKLYRKSIGSIVNINDVFHLTCNRA